MLLATPALAQNWVTLLKNTPAERFDEEDLRIFMDTARKALDEGKANQELTWENPKTRARGTFTVLRVFEWKSHPCKEVRVYNETPGRKGANDRALCQVDGKWRLVTASQLKKK
ncbi:MAG TPA: hypothetical protein VJQ58_15535 [Burkholderiales bacterium]|nr:hypothetical protein [Burkholderiales bacterium]